jgi:DNA-binding LytR/AlgR family response regulator
MITTLIADDEPLCLDELRYLLSQHSDIRVSFESDNLHDTLQFLKENIIDLVFLDIEMDYENAGLQIAQAISHLHNPPQIIFITAHPQHALKAFEFQALHYLLKPISDDNFNEALQRARNIFNNKNTKQKIQIKYKFIDEYGEIIRPTIYLYTNDILYIHKDKLSNTTKVYTANGNIYEGVRKTLQNFEAQFKNSNFFRIHTSYLVNLEYVQENKPGILGDENKIITLKNSVVELPVSKLKIAALKSALKC